MKKAFSLIELIFVVVIIGVISGIGFSMQKQNYAYRDGEVVLLKIKEARYKAMGFEGRLDEGCVVLDKDALNLLEQGTAGAYEIRSIISSTDLNNANPTQARICFDYLGRPYNGNNPTDLSMLLQTTADITVAFGQESCTIRLYPISGYGIIACGN